MNFSGIGFNADVVQTGVDECAREIAGAATDVEQGPACR
jgi:hypothetical protein